MARSRTGAAWLSSARVVRCWVKSRNSATPLARCQQVQLGTLAGTAADKAEEGGDDVKSSWPLCLGLHVLQWTAQKAATSDSGSES